MAEINYERTAIIGESNIGGAFELRTIINQNDMMIVKTCNGIDLVFMVIPKKYCKQIAETLIEYSKI